MKHFMLIILVLVVLGVTSTVVLAQNTKICTKTHKPYSPNEKIVRRKCEACKNTPETEAECIKYILEINGCVYTGAKYQREIFERYPPMHMEMGQIIDEVCMNRATNSCRNTGPLNPGMFEDESACMNEFGQWFQ